ncbi:MAG: hypothetical protein ABI847_21230, partial [Anaerolineales bacterium]
PTPIPPTATPTSLPQSAVAGEQKSILIVGVDDASAAQPVFEGCWVLSYRAGLPQYYFSSFPPDSSFFLVSVGMTQTLTQIYALDLKQELGFRLMREAIESRFPALKPQAEVVIDRRALADLVTQTGSLLIQGQSLSGPELLDNYSAQAALGTAERMSFQEMAVRALFSRLAESSWTPAGLAIYFQQQPGSRAIQLESFAAGAPALGTAGVNWTVYTPEQETSGAP